MEHAFMTPEMWTTISVAIALAGLVVGGHVATGRRLERVEARLNKRIDEQAAALDAFRKETAAEFKALHKDMGDQHRELGERVARFEGALDTLVGRRDAA